MCDPFFTLGSKLFFEDLGSGLWIKYGLKMAFFEAKDRFKTVDKWRAQSDIDAYVAHLYGLSRDDFAYILDTFPVLKRKEDPACANI